eukprot:scaffold217997_cov31-Tisochrysis_lutea.AAC.1
MAVDVNECRQPIGNTYTRHAAPRTNEHLKPSLRPFCALKNCLGSRSRSDGMACTTLLTSSPAWRMPPR